MDSDERQKKQVKRDFWPKIRRVARAIPFAEDALAAYYCAFDPKTPTRVRGSLLAALGYFILPFDALPDIIAGVGFTDDAAVLWGTITLVSSHITERHRRTARDTLAEDGFAGSADTTPRSDAA